MNNEKNVVYRYQKHIFGQNIVESRKERSFILLLSCRCYFLFCMCVLPLRSVLLQHFSHSCDVKVIIGLISNFNKKRNLQSLNLKTFVILKALKKKPCSLSVSEVVCLCEISVN